MMSFRSTNFEGFCRQYRCKLSIMISILNDSTPVKPQMLAKSFYQVETIEMMSLNVALSSQIHNLVDFSFPDRL